MSESAHMFYPRAGAKATIFANGEQIWIVGGYDSSRHGRNGIREIEVLEINAVLLLLCCVCVCVCVCLSQCVCSKKIF